jgi:hypothetical protein
MRLAQQVCCQSVEPWLALRAALRLSMSIKFRMLKENKR